MVSFSCFINGFPCVVTTGSEGSTLCVEDEDGEIFGKSRRYSKVGVLYKTIGPLKIFALKSCTCRQFDRISFDGIDVPWDSLDREFTFEWRLYFPKDPNSVTAEFRKIHGVKITQDGFSCPLQEKWADPGRLLLFLPTVKQAVPVGVLVSHDDGIANFASTRDLILTYHPVASEANQPTTYENTPSNKKGD